MPILFESGWCALAMVWRGLLVWRYTGLKGCTGMKFIWCATVWVGAKDWKQHFVLSKEKRYGFSLIFINTTLWCGSWVFYMNCWCVIKLFDAVKCTRTIVLFQRVSKRLNPILILELSSLWVMWLCYNFVTFNA